MRKEWIEHHRLLRREAALLRCDLINYSICRPEKRVELNDLLPGAGDERDSQLPVRMTAWRRREVADNWRRFMSSGFAGYTTVETPDAG